MKSVLITGGSRGIGRACVELFCREGYNVAFTYKSSAAEAEEISRLTGALAIQADSRCESDVIEAVKKTLAAFGKIDCLIYNSAVSSFSLLQAKGDVAYTIVETDNVAGSDIVNAVMSIDGVFAVRCY